MKLTDLITGFIVGVVTSLIATYIYNKGSERSGNRSLRRILNFGRDEIIFVFTHRDHVPRKILPMMSTEDFIAMNNVIGALMQTGWKGPVRIRDTRHLSDAERGKNIVSICSSKSNTFTKEVMDKLEQQGRSIYQFRQLLDNEDRWKISRKGVADYPSDSYDQEDEAKRANKEISEQELNDKAMIVKVTNPWNGSNKILIVAGIRGIGTWGAAYCLRKMADELYEKKSGSGNYKKDGDFAIVLTVTYDNLNIIKVDTHEMIDLS